MDDDVRADDVAVQRDDDGVARSDDESEGSEEDEEEQRDGDDDSDESAGESASESEDENVSEDQEQEMSRCGECGSRRERELLLPSSASDSRLSRIESISCSLCTTAYPTHNHDDSERPLRTMRTKIDSNPLQYPISPHRLSRSLSLALDRKV